MEETNETTAVHARFWEGSIYKCTRNSKKDMRFGGHDAVFTHESAWDLCDSEQHGVAGPCTGAFTVEGGRVVAVWAVLLLTTILMS